MHQPKYSSEEVVSRAEELYAREIRPKVENGNHGRIVVIDVETGQFELGDDLVETVHRLRTRNPDAVPYALRVGFPALAKMGGSWKAATR